LSTRSRAQAGEFSPARDVLVEPDADHPAAGRVDVQQVVVAVGDRDPVRRRFEHRAVAALGRAGARTQVLVGVDDEQRVAEARCRDVEAPGEVGALGERAALVNARTQRLAGVHHRREACEQLRREVRHHLEQAAAEQR